MSKRLSPCSRCGGPKPKKATTQGSRYCPACKAIVESPEYSAEQRRARDKRRRETKLASGEHQGRRRTADAPKGQKWCARCQQFLPLDSFAPSGDRVQAYCGPCTQAYNHEYRMVRDYGITTDRYLALVEAQQGRCAICLTKPRNRKLAVDHDHKSGEVRGLLCTRCNHGLLGKAHDSASMLFRALSYLQRPPAIYGMPDGVDHEQGDLEFIFEQLPFLRDGELARHATRDAVAITPRSFLALAQAAGFALVVEGERLTPPVQLAIDDVLLLEQLHLVSTEVK